MTGEGYKAADDRYAGGMSYARCGRSGVMLPRISLGMWQNFGETTPYSRSKEIILHAFDRGVTAIDLANNYGPPAGAAEETFGRVMREALRPYRDELFVATKAGYEMWPGPYGNWGSRKSLMASIDQSLRRTGLEYVDVFYSHRYDPATPLEETLQALSDIVRQGKALYAAISRWPREALLKGIEYLRRHDTPCLMLQDRLNMTDRHIAGDGLMQTVRDEGLGLVTFSPLAEGVLSNRYIDGIPADSRAARRSHLTPEKITPEMVARLRQLNELAAERGQSLAQMAIAWILSHGEVTSVIAGCSSTAQLDDTLRATENTVFSAEELKRIDKILGYE